MTWPNNLWNNENREEAMADGAITRRAAVGAAAAGAASLGGPAMAQAGARASVQANARKTFVLIHGAYHGGWCWRRVADLLERDGHKVYAPSLTGNGDRSHLLSLNVNLDTQIADIANLLTWEDLTGICLVAHSLGGWPSRRARNIQGRVASIVWLDAFKPKDGERAIDFISAHSRQATVNSVARGEAGRAPPPAKLFSSSEQDYAWIDAKLTAQPNGPALQPIRLTGKRETIAKKTYIRAPRYPQPAFDAALAECQADPSWQTIVNETTGHDVMIDQPEWLAEVLLRVA